MGRTKQNRYLYAPGDDPYRQDAVARALPGGPAGGLPRAGAAGPGQPCDPGLGGRPGPGAVLLLAGRPPGAAAKLDAMWALGVRAFQLQFQDVSYSEWHCGADAGATDRAPRRPPARRRTWPTRCAAPGGAAPGRRPRSSLLPTEYYQDGATAYRTRAGRGARPGRRGGLDRRGRRAGGDHRAAGRRRPDGAAHPLMTMDNYPVNDFARGPALPRPLHRARAGGRDRVRGTAGDRDAAARRLPDRAVHRRRLRVEPAGYDRAASWRAAVDDLAGPIPRPVALGALAGNEASSAWSGRVGVSAAADREFWRRRGRADRERPRAGGGGLRAAFTTMRGAPAPRTAGRRLLRRRGAAVAGPAARYGAAGEHAVDMLLAQARATAPAPGGTVWRWSAPARGSRTARPTVGARGARPVPGQDAGHGGRLDRRARRGPYGHRHPGLGPGHRPVADDRRQGRHRLVQRRPAPAGRRLRGRPGRHPQIRSVRIAMGAAQRGPERDDYLREAVLEYSAGDEGGWRTAATVHDDRTVTARLPEGTRARYVRLRATAAQENAVTVREFTVSTADEAPRRPRRRPRVPGGLRRRRHDHRPRARRGLTLEYGSARPLEALTVLTDTGPGTAGSVEVRVPGQGWHRLGSLGGGWTELPAQGLRADAVRVTPSAGAHPPVVHEIVPWYADRPAARMTLDRTDTDVEPGGAPASVTAELTDASPVAAGAPLTAEAPAGVVAVTPGEVELPRGGRVVVPVRLSLPADGVPGLYEVPLAFRAEGRTVRQTVTVHAYPRTGGPDLAAGASATSSGDETADFPASALTDGDPGTRWSSRVGTTRGCRPSCPRAAGSAGWCCTGRTRTPPATRS